MPIYHHAYTCQYLQVPTSTYKYLPIPTSTYKYLPVPASTYKYLPVPSSYPVSSTYQSRVAATPACSPLSPAPAASSSSQLLPATATATVTTTNNNNGCVLYLSLTNLDRSRFVRQDQSSPVKKNTQMFLWVTFTAQYVNTTRITTLTYKYCTHPTLSIYTHGAHTNSAFHPSGVRKWVAINVC